MSGGIPQAFIDDLLARTDIVELISRRVPLRKAGKDFQACCPFHDERTPSFTVSRDKQFYYCFGCGAHGTAIGFLMEYDRLGFREAVAELADQLGLDLPEPVVGSGPPLAPLFSVLQQAADLYRRQLNEHPSAASARAYLSRRGLSQEIIERFAVGYAPPEWEFLLARLGREANGLERLVQTGLVVEQDGRRYDRFRGRIMFPIRDRRGRVIGFGGRVLDDQKPKYLNSPETLVFHKGRELYGLYEACQAQRDLGRLMVVEGYMDVIALAQFGVPYGVATLGTATTSEHLKRLLAHGAELVFCFDGDRAGREAAWKALQTVLPHANGRHPFRFLFLPEGEDPDSLIRQEGREGLERRLDRASPLSDVLFEHLTRGLDLTSAEGRARLAWLADPLLKSVPGGTYRQILEERLARLVGVSLERSKTGFRPRAPRRRDGDRRVLTPMRRAIALILQHPRLAAEALALPDAWRGLTGPGAGLLSELLEILAVSPEITTGSLLERWRNRDDKIYVERLSDPGLIAHIPTEGLLQELTGAISALNRQAEEREAALLFARASPSQWSEADKERIRRTLTRRE